MSQKKRVIKGSRRLNLSLNQESVTRIHLIKQVTEAASITEVIRRALICYEEHLLKTKEVG